MSVTEAERGRMRSDTLSSVGATIVVCVAALAFFLVAQPSAASPPEGSAARGIAFALALAYPGIVAFVVRRRCPKLLLGAAVACLPCVPLSMGGAGFVLFLPALLIGAAAGVDCERAHGFGVHALAGIGIVVFGLAALWTGFPRDEPFAPVPFALLKTAIAVIIGVGLAAVLARSHRVERLTEHQHAHQ